MANELKRVGLVFTQEGAVDFKKTLQEINLEMNKNYNQFKSIQAQWDNSTKSTEKLRAEQEYLRNAYEIQTDKVNTLKMQLSDLENAENKNTTAIKKKRNELTNAEIKLETYNKRLQEIDNQLNNTGKKMEEWGKKAEEMGKKIEEAGKKLSAFSAATSVAFVASAKSAIDFESAFTGVEKTVDGTEEQMTKLKQGIRDLAKEIPSSTTEISAVAEAAGQLGIRTDNILSFSKAMIDLGNSTNLTADEAASQLAKFANIMQMSQKDFDRLGSSIVDLGNHFATTEADIVAMAMRLAGAGKQVGFSEGQVLGLATALSSVGIEAEMGGSAISKAMVKMQNAVEQGGTKLNDVLKKTGLTLRELELMSANDSKGFKELSQSIGMTSTEVKQLITAGTNLEDFSKVSGMTTEQFKKAWKEDAAGALSAFIKGLGDAENKGESAITMLSEMGLTEVRLRDSLLRAANAGNLFNDALETGTKAWEDNTALTKEANKRYDTLKSKFSITTNKIKDLGITFGNKLMPTLDKVNSKVGELTTWISNLNDEQVEWILKIGGVVVAAGPLITIMGKLTSTTGNVVKGIGNFSQALSVAKGNATTTSKTVNNLATLITSLHNPMNLAITAVGLLTTATMAYCIEVEKEKASLGGLRDEVEKQRKSWEELKEARNENLTSSINEMDSCERLVNELSKITDENGKIKDGYKERAQVIINELNKALGTEYKINGDIIDRYKELKQNINEIIIAKKAEAVLNAYQTEYGEAMKKEAEATQTLVELKKKLSEASKQMASGTALERSEAKKQYESIAREIGEQTRLISEYGKTITDYDELQKASIEGNAEAIKKATNSLTTSYEMVKQKTEESIEEQINIQAEYVGYLRQSWEEALETNNKYSEQILSNQLDIEQEKLDNLVDSLITQTSKIKELTPEQIEAWKSVAEQSGTKYREGLSKINEDTKKEIEKATGIIVNDTKLPEAAELKASSTSILFGDNLTLATISQDEINSASNIMNKDTSIEKAAMNLGKEVDQNFNNKLDGKTWGNDLVQNINSGLTNSSSINLIMKGASKVASTIKSILGFSLPEKGPLSDFDKSMPDMIDLMAEGIDNNKSKVVKSAKNMANDIDQELSGINGNVNFNAQTNSNAQSNVNVQFDYDKLSRSMLKALTGCKFTLDDDGFAKIVKDELYKVV